MRDEDAQEAELLAKGLKAPRLTPADIDARIVGEAYHVFPGTTLTVCALTLVNGFIVTGESAAASPENFDAEIGRQIARRNARRKFGRSRATGCGRGWLGKPSACSLLSDLHLDIACGRAV